VSCAKHRAHLRSLSRFLEPWINRFTFERKHCENAFVHVAQGGFRRTRFIRLEPAT